MSQAASEIEKIRGAIEALEAQRQNLGDEVIDAALEPLREKLSLLEAAALTEQRKQVTVLFADLVEHTRLFEQLDPEDVRELLKTYFAAWKEAIQQHGGVVEKYIGDAVMAVFGLPNAQEDDPERAIRAALAMRQRLREINRAFERELNASLAMRVGITTGEVVVGALGERQPGEFVVVGETVNLASRLQSAAPEDGILISHSVYRFVRGIFSVRLLEPIKVKGVAEPLQVYLVQEAKPRTFRISTRGVEGIETRMVGREADLLRLQNAFWEVSEDRQCQIITIVGEAGIGKSRLIYEFDNWLELLPEEVYYFKGRAYASTRNTPYSLLRSMFAFRFEIQDSDPPELVMEKLVRGIGDALAENGVTAKKAQWIGELLGFEMAGNGRQESVVQARQFREQALAYLGEYFRALAQRDPVVVLLEDIHWADDSSLDLIHWIDGSLAKIPLLVICTARPGLYQRRPNWGEGLLFYHRMDLRPLSKRESRGLVADILQRAENIPPVLQEIVVDRADGNPFFIEEGIKLLIEEGVIEKRSERWRIHADRLSGIKIPATLAGVLQARLDALATGERSLLQRAAVIGRIFWDQAVEFLDGQEGAEIRWNPVSAGEILLELRNREIVYQRERSSFKETHEYLFKHILMRDVAYESLLKRQRRTYHARAAEWLEGITQRNQQGDAYADSIAQHWEQAGKGEAASAWYRRAGKHAAARYANAEAVHALTKALELTPETDHLARFQIYLERERVLDRLGDRQRQAEDLASLAELGEILNDPGYQAEAALRRANFAFNTGAYEQAAAAAREAVSLAHQAGNVEKEAEGYHIWGSALDFQLTSPEGLEKLEQALKLAREARLVNLEADVLLSLGPHFSDLNQYGQARTYLSAALEIYQRLNDRWGEGRTLSNLGVTYWGEGRYSEAKAYFEAAMQAMREIGARRGEGIMLGNLGVIAHEQLDYAASRRYQLQALEVNREIRNLHSCCINLGNLAEAERELGIFPAAREHYEQALQLAQELGLVQNHSAILISFAVLKEYLGDLAAAVEDAQQGLVLARQAGSTMYEANSLHRLGHLFCLAGRYAEARAHFQSALDLQRSLGLETRAIEAQAGLANVSLAEGDMSGALNLIEGVLDYLKGHELLGTDEPSRVYLICSEVLRASGDPRLKDILAAGYRFLQARAASIEDEGIRRTYLEQIPWNRQLLELWSNV